MKTIVSLLAIAASMLISGCDHAPANVQTLVTTDCGVTWKVIKVGQRVPSTKLACEYKTILPDYPMQGDTEFKSQFTGNVLVTVRISYDYTIKDPIKFIDEAKFLGKQSSNASGDHNSANAAIELAENMVIDKRIREGVTSKTVKLDVVDFNPVAFEADLQKSVNEELKSRGVEIGSMTFVMIPEDQTRMAIDAATAVNVYTSKGLKEFGAVSYTHLRAHET
jgi:hypothetical protein